MRVRQIFSFALILLVINGFCGVATAREIEEQCRRYAVYEKSFRHSGHYDNPYADVVSTATLAIPGGGQIRMPMFWDGEQTWRLRFSPEVMGDWHFTVESNDPGLNGQTGKFICVNSFRKGGIRRMGGYPYHFAHQNGEPFWWFGDTNWSIYTNEEKDGQDHQAALNYIDGRAAQGFNAIHGILKIKGNTGGPIFIPVSKLGQDYKWDDGDKGDDPGMTINPEYWRELEMRVRRMNDKGITAGIFTGWAQAWVEDFGTMEARLRFLRYVAARTSALNVYYVISGESNEVGTREFYDELGRALDQYDPHHRLIGIHSTSTSEDWAEAPWNGFGDYQQLYSDLHKKIIGARDHNKPVVNGEYAYYLRDVDGDGNYDKPNSGSVDEIRHASWDIAMGGGYFVTGWGNTFAGGRKDQRKFDPTDPANKPWDEQAPLVAKCFQSMEWWKLHPHDELVREGGTAWCLAEPGRQYLVYLRDDAKGAQLNMTVQGLELKGVVFTAERYNPRTGETESLEKVSSDRQPVKLTVPDAQDWVYLLRRENMDRWQPSTLSIAADRDGVRPDETLMLRAEIGGGGRPDSFHWVIPELQPGDPIDADGELDRFLINRIPMVEENGAIRLKRSWKHECQIGLIAASSDDPETTTFSVSNQVVVRISQNQPPQIHDAVATPDSGKAPLKVTLSAIASDPNGDALTIGWDRDGDGQVDAPGRRVQLQYDKPGHYDPAVHVSDGKTTSTQQITLDIH